MKALDALISIWWSLTALATLYVVLDRPVETERAAPPAAAPTACELPSGPVMLRLVAPAQRAR